MTPIPLDQLGFGWRSHKSAMWWLGLLYRRPKDVRNQLDQMPKLAAAKTGFTLYWHNLPYLILLCVVFRLIRRRRMNKSPFRSGGERWLKNPTVNGVCECR